MGFPEIGGVGALYAEHDQGNGDQLDQLVHRLR